MPIEDEIGWPTVLFSICRHPRQTSRSWHVLNSVSVSALRRYVVLRHQYQPSCRIVAVLINMTSTSGSAVICCKEWSPPIFHDSTEKISDPLAIFVIVCRSLHIPRLSSFLRHQSIATRRRRIFLAFASCANMNNLVYTQGIPPAAILTVFCANSEVTALINHHNDDDIESLPSYRTIATDYPPTYCTYGICAMRRMSCIPAKCCIDRKLRMESRRERRQRRSCFGFCADDSAPVVFACGLVTMAVILLVGAVHAQL